MPPETTALVDPQGVIRDVPASQVAASIVAKWRAPTTEDTARLSGEAAQEHDYGGASGAVKAVLYGLARGGSVGLSDVGFRALGADPQDLKGYQQQNPGLSTGAELTAALLPGLVAPESFLARTPAGQVSKIGRSIVSGAEASGAGVLGRAAASTAGAATEGALYGGGQYLSQVALDDKPLAAEGFLAAMGKGALWAAPVGGALSLGESALVRAKSLFPRSEVSKQAARAVDQEATSAIAQSVQDGDMMVAAAQRRIAQASAAVGKAEAGERVARTMFGDAHPQAAIDQVTSGLEQQQLTQAVSDYTQSRQALADWVRAEADPDLEAALARIASPDVQVGAPRLRSPEFGEVVPPQGDLPSMGEFGLEKTAVGKKLAQGTPGPHVPPQVSVTTEMPPLPLGEVAAEQAGVTTPSTAGGAPVAREIGSEKEFKAMQEAFRSQLTPDEVKQAIEYSKEYYIPVNRKLRGVVTKTKIPGDEEVIARIVPALDSALAKTKTTEPLIVHRAAHFDPGEAGASLKPGDVFDDPAFVSVSYRSENINRFGNTHFEITAPTGTHMAPIPSNKREGEFLLPRNTKLKITSREELPNGRVKLRAVVESSEQPTVTDSLTGQLRGMQEQLASGADLKAMGAPSRAEYVANKAAKTEEAAAGFRAKAIEQHEVPAYDALKSKLDTGKTDYIEQTIPARKIAERGYYEPPGAGTDAVRVGKAQQAIKEGQREPISLLVTKDGKIVVEGGRHRLAAAVEQDAPIRVKWSTGHEPSAEMVLRGGTQKPNLDEFFANLNRPKSRDAYVAQNIGRAMREEGSHAAGLAKLEKEWAATAAPGRATGRETIPIDFKANGPRFDSKTRTYHGASEVPPSGEMSVGLNPRATPADVTGVHVQKARVGNLDDLRNFIESKDWSKVAPEEWLAQAESMGGLYGHSRDIAKTIVDKAIKPGMQRVIEEDAIQAALRKHNGKNVDIGADLSRAAQVLGDHEAANAKLVDLLGADAPRTAVENAKAYRAAVAAQHDSAAASAAQSASDLGSKVKPAIDGGTVVNGDITKALRKHDMASEAAAGRAVKSLGKQAAKEATPAAVSKSRGLLGVAADVGTALEVLHAMGVHTPDVSAIPVIGPVLSLFFKARAVLGVLGRKGGSVGRSTESVVAAKSAAIRDRINAAANSALDIGAKALRRAQPIAGPTGALAYKLFPGDGDTKSKDPRVLYQARIDELARAQVPGAIENAIADRIRTSDPVLQNALVQKSTKIIQFLDSKRPGQGLLQSPIPGDGDWRPSKSAIEEFSRYVAAAHDPAGVLEDLAHGHPSKEGAETLQAIYPELYAQGQRALLERASQIEHTLPYSRRVSISLMYQVPVDLTMSAAHMQYLKPPEPMPTAASPGPPPMGAPGLTGPLQLGQQMLTSLERRAGA